MTRLCDLTCKPCRGGVPPLTPDEIRRYLPQLSGEWSVEQDNRLVRRFKFPDFVAALEFVNRVGALAEQQGHHPNILLSWGKAAVTLTTHKIGGLSESDCILAAKIDRL